VLLVLFMAGYFTAKWERLRGARKAAGPGRVAMVKSSAVLTGATLSCAVACALAMFFF
jgi:hypothetical protein